jgi:phospholipase/carboxylesterase
MNRIKISPLATAQLDDVQTGQDSAVFSSVNSSAARPTTLSGKATEGEFSLFVPMHYEKNYAYPLVVWLHSDESDCGELQRLMPQISIRNYVAIAPQSGFSASAPISWPNCTESVDAAYAGVMAAIDEAMMRFNIQSKRIFIAGNGTGGTMAMRLAFERPDVFGGVISIDGAMDTQHLPLRDWERCRELPVLLSGFRQSDKYSQDDLCHHLRLLHVAGFETTVRQYPGPSNMSAKVLGDMDRWIMESISSSIR